MKKQFRTGKRSYREIDLPDTIHRMICDEREKALLQSLATVRMKQPDIKNTASFANYSIWCDVSYKLHEPVLHVNKPNPGFQFSFKFHEWLSISWILESITLDNELLKGIQIELLARINAEVLFHQTDNRLEHGT